MSNDNEISEARIQHVQDLIEKVTGEKVSYEEIRKSADELFGDRRSELRDTLSKAIASLQKSMVAESELLQELIEAVKEMRIEVTKLKEEVWTLQNR